MAQTNQTTIGRATYGRGPGRLFKGKKGESFSEAAGTGKGLGKAVRLMRHYDWESLAKP